MPRWNADAVKKFALICVLSGGLPIQHAPRAAGQSGVAVPQEVAPGILSTGHEFGMSFTPDGKEVYFSRFALNQPIHIFRSRLIHGAWEEPEKLSISSDSWSDLDPFVSVDGKKLFFISTRPDSSQGGSKNMDLWVANREGGTWRAPKRIENVNSASKEGSPSVAQDGTLYFFSGRSGGGEKNAIYESHLVGGQYVAPSLLPPAINARPSDTSPFITPNGRTLLFYSTREGGLGKADLYVSNRVDGVWGPSVNLGPKVNTAESEYNPTLSRDGRELYFGRNGRLYMVPVEAIPALKGYDLR
jgi:Tol biopolymer transport system component